MTRMIDISDKPQVDRMAKASGRIILKTETIQKIRSNEIPKGDVLSVSKTAGVMAVKKTTELIPLTHPIPITSVNVDFEFEGNCLKVELEVKSKGQTGVEMEALTGVSAVLLTIWDMVKTFEKDEDGQYPTIRINEIKVVEKVKN